MGKKTKEIQQNKELLRKKSTTPRHPQGTTHRGTNRSNTTPRNPNY